MAEYHSFIYDTERRRLRSDFEGAYAQCEDVWPSQHETDAAHFRTIIGTLCLRAEPSRVLDIGCGYGDFVVALAEQGHRATGLDISPSAIEQGLRRSPEGTDLRVGDIKQGLDFGDKEFDAVLLLGVLWFVLDRLDLCLAELDRVLKDAGWFFASLHIPANPIGAETIGDYEDFLGVVRRRFTVVDALKIYQRTSIAQGERLDECITDMLLVCKKP